MYRVLYVFFFLAAPIPLFAYLDPGSGSALLYALVGLFISISYFAQGLWLDVSLYFGRRQKGKNLLGTKADILFHSEGAQYDHLFVPVLKQFSGKERIVYITQYVRDGDRFPVLPDFVDHYVLDSGAKGFATLNLVQAKVFVTTTPQLGVMMFKRSKRVGHYCHLLHAASDITTYRFFAFDQFDSVLCAGDYMKESFRELERQRKTRRKQLFTTGITYFDEFSNQRPANGTEDGRPEGVGRKTILLAPSWGPNGIFSVYGPEFLKRLPAGYDIVIRPHPQLRISQKEIYDEVARLAAELGFELDLSPSNAAVLARADLMITDFSGVGYDFAFGYEKPVVVIDTHLDYSLFEGRFLNTALWPEGVRSSVGRTVDESNIGDLPAIIQASLEEGREQVRKTRDLYLANFGRASETAKDQLLEILGGIR